MAKRKPRIEVYDSIAGPDGPVEWHWRLVAGNGEILCSGEGHTSERDARRAVLTVQLAFLDDPRVEVVNGRDIS